MKEWDGGDISVAGECSILKVSKQSVLCLLIRPPFPFSHPQNTIPPQSDTEFWDKMQAEWEELARRNWLTENEQAQTPSSVSPHEKVTIFTFDLCYHSTLSIHPV